MPVTHRVLHRSATTRTAGATQPYPTHPARHSTRRRDDLDELRAGVNRTGERTPGTARLLEPETETGGPLSCRR